MRARKGKKESTQTAVKRTNAGPMTPRNRTFFLPLCLFFSALFALSSFSLGCSYRYRYCFVLFLRQEREWDWKKENSRWNTTECLDMHAYVVLLVDEVAQKQQKYLLIYITMTHTIIYCICKQWKLWYILHKVICYFTYDELSLLSRKKRQDA